MGTRKKRLEVKITERDYQLLTEVAEMLTMTRGEVIRNSLKFGLAALIKFETGSKERFKELIKKDVSALQQTRPASPQNYDTPKKEPNKDTTKNVDDEEMDEMRKGDYKKSHPDATDEEVNEWLKKQKEREKELDRLGKAHG